jgi:4-amino-4-deoxy-L-arabinose transferase-like glycosyltransferase
MSTMLSPESNNTSWHFRQGRPAQHSVAVVVLTALSFVLFFHHVDRRALWSSHEGRAGQYAQLMLDTGRWGMPTLYYGEADYQKPPLYYWMVAGVAWLRGGVVGAWDIRLPAATTALIGGWLIYAVGATVWRPATGFVAALILMCNLRYSWLARVGRIDMPLTLAVSVALLCFYFGYCHTTGSNSPPRGKRARWWMVSAYLAVAVAVMLKGPIGFILPAIPAVLFLMVERHSIWPWQEGFRDSMRRLGVWWGIPLVLLLAAPWFVWATVVTKGEFFKTFFLHHNLDRTLGVEGLKPEPFWYYVPRICLDFFPWSILLPPAIWKILRKRDRGEPARLDQAISDETSRAGRFALCWFGGMFVFLSLVRFKRHDYLLPVLPGAALLVANYWNRFVEARDAAGDWRWARALVLLTAAGVGMTGAGLTALRNFDFVERLVDSPKVTRLVHDTDRMVFSQLRDALPQSIGNGLALSFVFIAAIACGLLVAFARRPLAAATFVSVIWLVGFVFYVDRVLPVLEPLREQRMLAQEARRLAPPGETIYYYGREDQQLMFYLGPGTQWLQNRAVLRPVITSARPVFVVMELERFQIRQKDWPEVPMVPVSRNFDDSKGAHRDPTVLVTNAAGWELVRSRRGLSGVLAN